MGQRGAIVGVVLGVLISILTFFVSGQTKIMWAVVSLLSIIILAGFGYFVEDLKDKMAQ